MIQVEIAPLGVADCLKKLPGLVQMFYILIRMVVLQVYTFVQSRQIAYLECMILLYVIWISMKKVKLYFDS